MKFTVQLVIEPGDGSKVVTEVATLEREALTEATLGLTLAESKTILAVPRYDFNWQTYYVFKEPLQAPKGAKLVSTAWYDNSAANKSNPDPKVDVHWGEQTWEEMQFTALTMTIGPSDARPTGGQ